MSHHTLIVAPVSLFPATEGSGGGAKQNNVGVKHTQRHPKSCFFSPFSVFCFFLCFLFFRRVYACARECECTFPCVRALRGARAVVVQSLRKKVEQKTSDEGGTLVIM